MKKTIKSTLALILALLMTLCLVACKEQAETPETSAGASENGGAIAPEGLWANATYLTDAETLGDALLAHSLIAGDQGDFGLYVKVVNGITADYDVDQSWWGFYKNGELLLTGVDMTAFEDGDHYELKYEK